MKNLNYFPCERNRYYYGKLLGVQDFKQEQKYMNDKRRLATRFLHGTGIAAGLKVIAVDEKSISVEAGAAFDFSGREIFVDTPVIRKLSLIDGFSAVMEDRDREYVYLCIEYGEEDRLPSFSSAAEGGPARGEEFDRTREGYRLYLTFDEADNRLQSRRSMYQREETLYEAGGLLVRQIIPSCAESGRPFPVTVEVENRGRDRKVSLSMAQELSMASFEGKNSWNYALTGRFMERGSKISETFWFQAMALDQGEARFTLKARELTVFAGEEKRQNQGEFVMQTPVVTGKFWEESGRRHQEEAMDRVMKNNFPQGIYLARIYLVKTEGAYMIGRVDSNPFGQNLESTEALMGYISMLKAEVDRLKSAKKEPVRRTETGQTADHEDDGAMGFVTLDLGIGGKRGQRYFSREIFHGLGLGEVQISLAVCEDEISYSGSGEVFEDMKVKAELAVKSDQGKGSFVIGARLLEPSSERRLRIRWAARIVKREETGDGGAPRLYIKPSSLQMKVRQTAYLETECVNMMNPQILWSVKGKNSGTITKDGLYTAPNEPGVYEVTASSEEDPDRKAVLFVVVRE